MLGQKRLDRRGRRCLGQALEQEGEVGAGLEPIGLGRLDQGVEHGAGTGAAGGCH